MSFNLSPKSLPALLSESFAFLSINFRKLLLIFILPAIPVFFSGILFKTGLTFLKSGKTKPFTLRIRQHRGQSFLLNGKKIRKTLKESEGVSRIEGLPLGKKIPLQTRADIKIPAKPGRLFLIRKGEISIIKREDSGRILKTLGVPERRDRTTVFWINRYGWELLVNGKKAVLDHTDRNHVRMLRLKKPEITKLTIRHFTEINTACKNSGWIDGLYFTYGSPAIKTAGWLDTAVQIGSFILAMLLTALLICMIFTAIFNSNRISLQGLRTSFRISGMRIMAALVFITLIQFPLLGLMQGNLLPGGGGMMLFLMIPVLLILAAKISPTLFIAQMEGLSPWQALIRSFQLTRGYTMRFFLVISAVLFTLILFLNLAGIITAELLHIDRESVISVMTGVINGRVYVWPEALLLLFGTILVMMLPLIPVIIHLLYTLYIDTRIRKEGLEGAPAEALLPGNRKN